MPERILKAKEYAKDLALKLRNRENVPEGELFVDEDFASYTLKSPPENLERLTAGLHYNNGRIRQAFGVSTFHDSERPGAQLIAAQVCWYEKEKNKKDNEVQVAGHLPKAQTQSRWELQFNQD